MKNVILLLQEMFALWAWKWNAFVFYSAYLILCGIIVKYWTISLRLELVQSSQSENNVLLYARWYWGSKCCIYMYLWWCIIDL